MCVRLHLIRRISNSIIDYGLTMIILRIAYAMNFRINYNTCLYMSDMLMDL